MNRPRHTRNRCRLPADFRLARPALVVGILILTLRGAVLLGADAESEQVDFVRDIQPILASRCVDCHGEKSSKSGLRLDVKSTALAGGDSGTVIVPGESSRSQLLERIRSTEADRMPPEGDPLSPAEIELIQRWIDQGAAWPDGVDKAKLADKYDWWSLKPLVRPGIPSAGQQARFSSPIDAFIVARLQQIGLQLSPEADRRTLARRLYFDLTGLPPDPDEVDAFVADTDPNAYENLVDRLLASPHYGERWARHWLDVVHYGDTHGYDKDKPRPNAWPYRDYVIRAFNTDKPYAQFIHEQLAGDILAPFDADAVTATGFIAAGPWDFIGHAEVPESKTDGMIARMLDRDDMVSNACNTFLSLTVQCARCHNHKFDPVVQEDYYRLQAIFAALDRADRAYDIDPHVAGKRSELQARQIAARTQLRQLEANVKELGGDELAQLDAQIAAMSQPATHPLAAQFGYHSQIESTADQAKWVQVDLGQSESIIEVRIVGCHDDFNNIGAGFGFPLRLKIEVSDDESFSGSVTCVRDHTQDELKNPGVTPLRVTFPEVQGRFVRVTATRLAERQNDFIFALAELSVFDGTGANLAQGKPVRALDSIEAPPRWQKSNLVDGYFVGVEPSHEGSLAELTQRREELLKSKVDSLTRKRLSDVQQELAETTAQLARLPAQHQVYSGMVYSGSGTFTGTGPSGGKPRPIHVLARGDVRKPLKEVVPGVVPLRQDQPGELVLPEDHSEGQRRVAFARWITANENPLTWRSIVNRLWLYHFGRGIVDSPNDFGRMGQLPSHPELLDWLAIEFRDGGQSFKRLHRLILCSATYRQSSGLDQGGSQPTSATHPGATRPVNPATVDASNVYLWRMNRRRLEAESVRDAVLHISGKLNPHLGGPAFQDFVVEKPEHSPHYEYQLHDAEDPRIHRRSVYRFLVRSQPQPFMTTLDCADPSMSVDKRNETVTALQALAMWNNRLMLTMEKYMAQRVASEQHDLAGQVRTAFRLALSRSPTPSELDELVAYTESHGLDSLCRVLMNLNEFVFID
ncbi:DUF1549 domain-containing protein [Schlesneria sp. DSM 10557]|uniref:DUF1549 domain-containing protein n=1 Tax=Schlesneria sp. DSM 10557 TaxID=3044399 RepID=UPI00359F63EC